MMKAQILKLLSFFQSISTLVDFVANQHVKDFLSGVKAGLRSNETLKLAGISFTDFQKQVSINAENLTSSQTLTCPIGMLLDLVYLNFDS